jgi:CspA family cold shock protein
MRNDGGGGAQSSVDGTVKFFSPEKGFGFVKPDDGGKDIFISGRALEKSGLATLQPEQRVRVRVRFGQKGPMADRIDPI